MNNTLKPESLPSMCLIPREALVELVNITATTTANEILRGQGLLKDQISQREAHRLFGSGVVQSLFIQGRIQRSVGKGKRSKITYYRSQIESALKLNGINLLF